MIKKIASAKIQKTKGILSIERLVSIKSLRIKKLQYFKPHYAIGFVMKIQSAINQ